MSTTPNTLDLTLGREQTYEILTALRNDAARKRAFDTDALNAKAALIDGVADSIEAKAMRTFAPDVTANGFDEIAAATANPAEIVSRAADALSDLSALVESGTARLTAYPSELPSLDELAAAVYAIETARAFSHDQLVAFSRIAGDAADGHFVDGNGACAALSLATAPNGLAIVTVDGAQVATIDTAGTVTYHADGRAV